MKVILKDFMQRFYSGETRKRKKQSKLLSDGGSASVEAILEKVKSKSSCTLFQHLYGHFPVLFGPNGFPYLSKVSFSQFVVQFELFPRSLPRLHVEEFPLRKHTNKTFQTFSAVGYRSRTSAVVLRAQGNHLDTKVEHFQKF